MSIARRSRLAVARVAWVAGLARALDIPAVVTEEDPATNGPTVAERARAPPCLDHGARQAGLRRRRQPADPRRARCDGAPHGRRRRARDRRLRRPLGNLADGARLPRRGRQRRPVLARGRTRARAGTAAGRGRAAALGQGVVLRLDALARGCAGAGAGRIPSWRRLPASRSDYQRPISRAQRTTSCAQALFDCFFVPSVPCTQIEPDVRLDSARSLNFTQRLVGTLRKACATCRPAVRNVMSTREWLLLSSSMRTTGIPSGRPCG